MAKMFTDAAAYDHFMGRWSTQLAPLFLDFARISAGERFLDVGCGTGSLTASLAARVPVAHVVGIDASRAFVEHCVGRFPGTQFAFDHGNAMALPYAEDAFDHALSLLVFMFIPDPAQAASEMRRVTRPRGTIAACTWDSAPGLELSAIFWEEATRLDPGAAHRVERPRHCNQEGQLAAVWRAAGLEQVEECALEMWTDFASFDDYWLPFNDRAGPQSAYLLDQPTETRDALRNALRQRLLGNGPDRPFRLRAKAWAVQGVSPAKSA